MRPATPADRDAVLAFATRTWDGWDYIPHAWPAWVSAPDGTLLVGCVGRGVDGGPPLDAEGDPLEVGQPVAIARVARLSPSEGWLEGIRVDPRVRGTGVGTDLQVAELHVLAQWSVDVVRYATGAQNEGSHRLGGRHGFELLTRFRTFAWRDPDGSSADDLDEAHGFDEATRAEATRHRGEIIERAGVAGLALCAADRDGAWARVAASPTFAAGKRLYELRSWAMQELTADRFSAHVDAAEAFAVEDRDGWAVAILPAQAMPAEDVSIHLALIDGVGPARARLVTELRRLADEPIRFRLPADDPATTQAESADLGAAGFEARAWELHVLGRPIEPTDRLPAVDPRRLQLQVA